MTNPHTSRHDELLPAYALGGLEEEDLRELQAHLATGCPECRRQLAFWQGSLEALTASIPPVEPATRTREQVLRRAGAGRPARQAPRLRWLALPAAALLSFVVIWAAWAGVRQARLGRKVEHLRAERDLLERQVASLGRELGVARTEARRMAATLAILSTPGARAIRLAGLEPAPGAIGETFIEPWHGRAVFWAFHLPAPAPGKTYQLWWIGSAGPVSAGTFDVDARGQGRVEIDRVDRPEEVQAWAVTIEPAGGVPQPTGAMVLKG
jgi:anti-sigma-K factor RskA